jgi:hypothetical protein
MSYQTLSCWALPGELLLACAGIAAIDNVLPARLSICRLTLLLLFAIDPAVDGSVTPLSCLFSCRDDALYWAVALTSTLNALADSDTLVVDVTRSLA